MKTIRIVLICLIAIGPLLAQDKAQVPPDVNYKTAPDAVNDAAKLLLQQALAGDKAATKQLLSDSLTCGPMLWQSLQPTADKSLVNAKKIIAVIGVPKPTPTEGRSFVTEDERRIFWKELFTKYPALAGPIGIRKANAWEISYYWATVPFDIQEPFFAIEAGPDVFIANLRTFDGKPVLFWFDRVGDFQHLQPQNSAQGTEQKK
jgi:hypothetical protein